MLAVLSAAAAASIPTVEVAAGVHMPQINLGCCCGSEPKVGLQPWLDTGARGIDEAYNYNNQGDVKKVLQKTGAPSRGELFITTKIPAGYGRGTDCSSGSQGQQVAFNYVKTNLQQLGVDYVDLVLLHKGCGNDADNQALWKGLEQALAQNLTRSIGVSNYNTNEIKGLMKTATVKPAVNQCRMSVKNHDDSTIAYCQQQGIAYEAFEAMNDCDFSNSKLKAIAAAHNKSVPQVCLRYIIERGCIMAVGTGSDSSTAGTYAKSDIDIFDFKLTSEEMDTLKKL